MRTPFAEAFVDLDGLRVRYLAAGSGRAVVWLPGSGGLSLSRAHELLAERYRVIAIDVPGRGASAAREPLPASADLGTTVARATAQLGLERFNLWGTSSGAALAVRAASSALDRVEALVLESPRAETESVLATLPTPTLVVFGTRDTVTPPELGRIFREKMPNCQFVLVYDAGHDVGADRPEAFSSLMGDFLERREAFIVSQKSSLLHP